MTREAAALSAEPNVTPMIDVVLVMLIVFMMAVIQVHRTVDVQLPQPCDGVCDASHPIVLEVLPGPVYRINTREVFPGELAAELSRVYERRPEKIIQVAGHPTVRYEEVVAAMDIARSAGVRVIGIAPRESYLPR
jgi:biopolymer transport protein TolR